MNYSSYFCIHRKVLNRIHRHKNYHPSRDENFMNSHNGVYKSALYQLQDDKFVLLDDKTCELSVGGHQLREALNQQYRETYIPMWVSAFAALMAAGTLIMQLLKG